MEDGSALLATLSQSSAAMVAIIGGFLVSRLVAISSERESIKRQLKAAQVRHELLVQEYEPVHHDRLLGSVEDMEEWLRKDLIDSRNSNQHRSIDDLLDGNIPRGSSLEEMRPFAEDFRSRIDQVFDHVLQYIAGVDGRGIRIDELKRRGLSFKDAESELYEDVFRAVEKACKSRQRAPSAFGRRRHCF